MSLVTNRSAPAFHLTLQLTGRMGWVDFFLLLPIAQVLENGNELAEGQKREGDRA